MATPKLTSSWSAKAGVVLIIVALVIMQSSNAVAGPPRAPQGGQSTWSTVNKVAIGGSISALGMGGLICGLLTVGCPVGIAIAGGVLGAIGGTIALFPEPPAPISPFPSGPQNWPDAPAPGDPCGMDCNSGNQSAGAGSGGGGGSAMPMPEDFLRLPTPGKVKVLISPLGRSNGFADAAKKVMHSFDWRQSAFDAVHQGLLDRQRSGLFVGAPSASSRITLKLAPGPVQIGVLPSHRGLVGR